MDPNDLPAEPDASIDQQPLPAPPPRPSREELIGALAEEYGWTPEQVAGSLHLRSEYERASAETTRRLQALEQRERELEEEREQSRFRAQMPEFADPGARMMYEMFMEDRQERKRERAERARIEQENREAQRQGQELGDAFERHSAVLPTHQRMQLPQFIEGGMKRLYPYGIPQGLSPDQAVRNTFQFLGLGNGHAPPGPQLNGRGPRATITIPGTSTAEPPTFDEGGPQRPGESLEAYVMRRRRYNAENNVQTTPQRDGVRYVIE